MNGIALLMIAATLGVEYDWGTTDDGQIEYVLIVEPEFLTSLANGDEIRSSVPPELESVQRLRIRIAPPANAPASASQRKLPASAFTSGAVRGATDPPTILWKANGQPEQNFNVRFGWQPTKEGLLEYFVQIDPKLLRTLAPGDEIYTQLSTESGRVDTFVVFSNTKPLPKVPGRPAPAPLAASSQPVGAFGGNNLAGNNFAATSPATTDLNKPRTGIGAPPLGPPPSNLAGSNPPFSSPAFGAGAASSPSPAPLAPAASPWSTTPTSPTTPGFNSPTTGLGSNGFGSNPAAGSTGGFSNPPRPFAGTTGSTFDRDTSRVNPAAGYDAVQPTAQGGNDFQNTRPGIAPPPTGYTNDYRNPTQENGLRGSGLNPPALNSDPYGRDQYGRDLNPPGAPRNDPFPNNNNNNFAGNNYANTPQNPNYRSNDHLAPAGSVPYRPGVGLPQDNQLAGRNYGDPNMGSGQSVDFRPISGDNQMASLPSNSNLNRPLSNTRVDSKGNPLPVVEAEKPWWPLLFTVIILFFSIGANLYLGWTAAEFYSRYRLAVERLRSSGGRS
ncbi:hypothetical protein NA78x_004031 [Anatilimnocola sp. NA78]|uniref:hypothetical protein n=1 Tax=Anatilimnocola sp. NA78 TaxID=3415683 RepID=UPI003CE4AE6A